MQSSIAGMPSAINERDWTPILKPFVARFWHFNYFYTAFHALFSLALFFQLFFFSLFFSKFAHTALIAFYLASIFLTIFTYLVLIFYLQARRPEKLFALCDEFVSICKKGLPHSADSLEWHRATAEAIVLLIDQLSIAPVNAPWIQFSDTLMELVEKFRFWTRWKDLLKMKEILFMAAIRERIEFIKKVPSDLEAHAALANSYLALSKIYQDPQILTLNEALEWIPSEYRSEKMRQKYQATLLRALEEYQIMDGYIPNSPWVYAAQAALYHKLENVDREIEQYERIVGITPQNDAILLRLGILYFKQGKNAAGLKMYEQLRQLAPENAKQLIEHYDAYILDNEAKIF